MVDDNLLAARETYQRAIEDADARWSTDDVEDEAARRYYERRRTLELSAAAHEIAAMHRLTVPQLLHLVEADR